MLSRLRKDYKEVCNMDFKTFFVKKIVLGFFISFTCISIAMLVVGLIYEPDATFGYDLFLSPLLFSLVAVIPSFIHYANHELSVKAIIIRKVLHLVLLEVLILGILAYANRLSSIQMTLSLGLSILIIDLTVNLIFYMNDKKTADDLNQAIKALHMRQSEHVQ